MVKYHNETQGKIEYDKIASGKGNSYNGKYLEPMIPMILETMILLTGVDDIHSDI